jgi:predicted phage replisome organizer/uncharacterized phage protein (TIGR02220 family)
MKRYYWLKLKDDFFTQKAIKKLRKIAGGDTFTIIYLKMMLLAMKSDGKLYFEGIENNFYEELALELDEDEANVNLTVNYLMNHGLMEESQNEYFLPESVSNVGSETDSAERVRKFRQKTLHGNIDVTPSNAQVTQRREEKSREDKEKIREDKDKKEDVQMLQQMYNKSTPKKKHSSEAEEILSYLNLKSGSNYRLIDSNLKLIDTTLKKGYTKQDCYTVIDKKVQEWSGTDMQQYLRPLTLFSSKFDAYLNQPMTRKRSEFETTQDNLKGLYDKYGGETDGEERNNKNIFDI